MKKYIAFILALLLSASTCSVFAEEAEEYKIPTTVVFGVKPHEVELNAVELPNKEKISQIIFEGLQNHEQTISLGEYSVRCNTPAERDKAVSDLTSLCYIVLDAHPELFYAYTGFGCGWSYPAGCAETGPFEVNVVAPCYLDGAYEMREAFNIKIDNILKQTITDDMTDAQKAFALHEYLIANTNYGYLFQNAAGKWITVAELTNDIRNIFNTNEDDCTPEEWAAYQKVWQSHTAYGAILNGVGVCQSYALSYKLLCTKVGIECRTIYTESPDHVWNLVRIGKQWYHVDVTYDDPIIGSLNADGTQIAFGAVHTNFLASDNRIFNDNHKEDAYVYDSEAKDVYDYEKICTDTSYELAKLAEIKQPVYCYDGFYYYYDKDAFEYRKSPMNRSSSSVKITESDYIEAVNSAAAAPYTVSGDKTTASMYIDSEEPIASLRLRDLQKAGFSIASSDKTDTVNVWIGFYDESAVLLGCRLCTAPLKNGKADIDLSVVAPYQDAVQARIFIWDGQKGSLRPLTDEFLKIV